MGLSVDKKNKLKELIDLASKGPWQSSSQLLHEAIMNPPERLVDLTDTQINKTLKYAKSIVNYSPPSFKKGKYFSIWND